MFCKYCGKQIPDGAKFCPSCGRPVKTAPTHQWLLSVIGPQPYFTTGSYFVWAGCFLSFLSLFLCFCTVTLYSTHLITLLDLDHSTWIVALLLAIALVNLFRLYAADIIGTGILAVIIWNYASRIDHYLGLVGQTGSLSGAETLPGGIISFSLGLYVMILGILLMLAGAVFGLVRTILEYREED